MRASKLLIVILILICLLPVSVWAISILPGEHDSWGLSTVAGSGRHLGTPNADVYTVTNLNASGSGSLDAAIDSHNAKDGSGTQVASVIIFETSGTIEADFGITKPYLTIAGQTAPSPGILIRGRMYVLDAHDVLIQHLRIRDTGREDVVRIGQANDTYNVVLDHLSVSWGGDENVSSYGWDGSLVDNDPDTPGSGYCPNNVYNITFVDSITAEGIGDPGSRGLLYGTQDNSCNFYNFEILRSLFMSNQARMPEISSVSTVMVNSYVYNWRWTAANIAERYSIDMSMSLVGNVFDRGPSNQGSTLPIWCQGRAGSPYYSECWPSTKIYLSDNSCPDDVSCWQDDGNADVVGTAVEATWPTGLTAMAASAVWSYMQDNVGAWPIARDSVDTRLISEVDGGTGSTKDSVPSFPTIAVNTRSLSLPANPHDDDDSDGYTNLEEWLHGYATVVEGGADEYDVFGQIIFK